MLVDKIRKHLRQPARGQDAGDLGPGVQAAHRRHPRGAGAGADRRHAGRGRAICASTIPRRWPTSGRIYGDKLVYCDRPYGALEGADGLAIVTEWQEFRNPDFRLMRRLLTQPVIFDGRNLYEPAGDGGARLHVLRDRPLKPVYSRDPEGDASLRVAAKRNREHITYRPSPSCNRIAR